MGLQSSLRRSSVLMDKIDERFYDDGAYFEKGELVDFGSRLQRYRVSKVLDIFTPSHEDVVLDLGCGWGTFTFALAGKVKKIIGLDFSKKSIDSCKNMLAETGYDNVELIRADASETGLPDSSIDVIICADLLEHLYPDDSLRVYDECARLLRNGGRLVVWTPCRSHFLEVLKNNDILLSRDVSHMDYKSMEDITGELGKRGFRILKSYYEASHIPVLNIIERALMHASSLFRRRIAVLAVKE